MTMKFPTMLKAPHRNKGLVSEKQMIGILSFDVSRLMSRVAKLWHCLSDKQMSRLREELRCSFGIRTLISDDHAYLIDLALQEIVDNVKGVALSVARLGKKCSDPIYHNLDNVFNNPLEIDIKWCGWEYRLKKMEKRVIKMKKFAAFMSQMYEELEVLSELETSLTRMQSNVANQEQMQEVHQKISWRREEVSRLRGISPWVRSYDYIVRLLLRSLFTIVERIKVVFGIKTGIGSSEVTNLHHNGCFVHKNSISAITRASVYPSEGYLRRSVSNPATCSFSARNIFQNDVFDPIKKVNLSFETKQRLVNGQEPTLGNAGLALLYANIIIFIETLAKSPRFINADARDDLYDMLTTNIKQSLREKLLLSKKEDLYANDESMALERRSSVQRILDWLSPLAHNMIKWYSDRSFIKHATDSGGSVFSVQTLYYADQAASEMAITELIVGLHYVSKVSQKIIDRSFLRCA
ncbi:hypothetical protein QVD17_11625 [Tagetes erecta]|uniref:Uncharacterized protein n=1 Tax=Tagetes erecta TaxID=13708 RepID=A0AAD8KYB4_TARER|nr:hypothetical protein QVD17_11625 [Tagetes erecta]